MIKCYDKNKYIDKKLSYGNSASNRLDRDYRMQELAYRCTKKRK